MWSGVGETYALLWDVCVDHVIVRVHSLIESGHRLADRD